MTEAIFFSVLEWSVRATLLVGLVALGLWLFRVKNVHTKLTAWTAVVVALLLMPALTFVLEPIPLWLPTAASAPKTPDAGMIVPLIRVIDANTTTVVTVSDANWWVNVAVGCWLLIAVALLLKVAVGHAMVARLRRSGNRVDVDVVESSAVRTPFTAGVFRPFIVLPVEWRAWDKETASAVLVHERSHVARRDPLRVCLASVLRAVAWFHPLTWWLRSHVAELAELASDDAVLSSGRDRVKYAETLVTFIELAQSGVHLEGVAMASSRTRARRIERVLDSRHMPSRRMGRIMTSSVALVLMSVCYVTAVTRPQSLEAQSVAAPAVVVPSAKCGGSGPYAKWLNEDVAYIITPAELEQFLRLGSAPECAAFIQDFWAKRGDEAKEEHYRRIAWVNGRYPGEPPGWTTDRGRIYILYGPPAEIESHPSGRRIQRPPAQGGGITATHPFELWLYRHVPGIGDDIRFEFVDNKMDGSYSLVAVRDRTDTAILQRPPGQPGAGPIHAILLNPRVFIDGADRGSAGVTSVSGSVLFAAHRGVGGFEIGFEADRLPGSAAIGVVKGNRLEAQAGGHTLRIEASAPIFAGQTVTVYGRFDPKYEAREKVEFGAGTLSPLIGVPLRMPE